MPSRRLLGRPDPDQVMVDRELEDELEVDGPIPDGPLPDEDIEDSDPETHWGLEKQTSRLKSPPPPPKALDDDGDEDDSSTDDLSSSATSEPSTAPARKLVPRSQVSRQAVELGSDSSGGDDDAPIVKRSVKSQARRVWEGEDEIEEGKEDEISIAIGQTEADRSGDEEEYKQRQRVLGVETDDEDELALVSQVKDAVVRSSARKSTRQRAPPASSAARPSQPKMPSSAASSSRLPPSSDPKPSSSPTKRARAATPSSSASASAEDPLQLRAESSSASKPLNRQPPSSSTRSHTYTRKKKASVTPTRPARSSTTPAAAISSVSGSELSEPSDEWEDADMAINKSLSAKSKGKQKAVAESPLKKRRVVTRRTDSGEDSEPRPRRSSNRRKERAQAVRSSSEDEEEPQVVPRRGTGSKSQQRMVSLSSDDDDDEQMAQSSDHSPPGKRRPGRVLSGKGKGKARVDPDEEAEEEDLMDSGGELPTATQTRLRKKVTRTGSNPTKASALDLLKQKRTQKGNNGASHASAVHVLDDSDDSNAEASDESVDGAIDVDGSGVEGEEEDEDDFIVQDDGHAELPAEFQTVQPMAQQYAVVVQYHIYLIILGFRKCHKLFGKDDYFQPALRRVRNMMRDLMNSKIRSQAWPPHYVKALERFPRWTQDHLDDLPPCDACRISNRTSTVKLDLEGKPYSRESFEKLDPDEDDEDDEDRNFNLGRHCAARSNLYHAFAHWEYDLHDFLEDEIKRLPDEADSEDDEAVPSRQFVPANDFFSRRKRGPRPAKDDVDGIIKYFDSRGIMAEEYEKIEQLKSRQADVYARGEED